MARTTIAAQHARLMTRASQKRLRILGTSCQKFDRSTSFFVAPHGMLYEKRWASRAWERWILSPPKKKKLPMTSVVARRSARREETQQEGHPCEVFKERVQEVALAQSVLEQCESDVPCAGKDDRAR